VPVSDHTGAWLETNARSAALVTPGFAVAGAMGALLAIAGGAVLEGAVEGSSTGGGGE
jgi:hypothetical protein